MKNWKMKSNFDSTPPSAKADTSPQSREGLKKVCVALLQSREGLRKVCVALPQSGEGLRKVCVALLQSGEGLRKSLKN